MNTLQEHARQLYFYGQKTQKEIAEEIGVTEKTIYNWVQQFSWYQQREAQLNTISLIAENICKQLIAFQQVIATREEGKAIPTIQEINLQCKMINMLDKLRKQQGRQSNAHSIARFLHFVNDRDTALGNTLFEQYALYSQKGNKKTADTKPEFNAEIASDNVSMYHQAIDSAFIGNASPPVKTGNEIVSERPPFSVQDFNDYKHLLGSFGSLTDNTLIRFRGKRVNAKWLEYNLLQYTLPVSDRRFIGDARILLTEIDYSVTQLMIHQYLQRSVSIAA